MTRKEFHKRLLITSLLLGLVLLGKCTGNIIIKPDQKSGGSRAGRNDFCRGRGYFGRRRRILGDGL